jgi:hypothetical protein
MQATYKNYPEQNNKWTMTITQEERIIAVISSCYKNILKVA